MEISNFDAEYIDGQTADQWRFRVQWDISF